MKKPSLLLKLGGSSLNASLTLEIAAAAIQSYRALGHSVIVVHGGGPAINAELTRRGITWTFVNGQRVTTPSMIEAIESTLCGTVNRRLVRSFGAHGLPAVGFSGVDHQTLFCKQASAELGLVGSIQKVNAVWIKELMSLPSSPLPVIAPLGVGRVGECYNINADWAASHLAVALQVDQLVFLTDQPGVLDEEGQVISQVDAGGMGNMIEFKVVSGGMLAKTQAALHALKQGVPQIRILKALDALNAVEDNDLGTHCVTDILPPSVVSKGEESYAAI